VVRAQDAAGNTGYANIEIIDAPVIQPTSKTLAVNNKFPFAVLSGKAPYTFSITSGEGAINSTTGESTFQLLMVEIADKLIMAMIASALVLQPLLIVAWATGIPIIPPGPFVVGATGASASSRGSLQLT
jgi:hypothetical protein